MKAEPTPSARKVATWSELPDRQPSYALVANEDQVFALILKRRPI